MKKHIVVCGAGGFIGSHLVKKLKSEGHHVIGVDLKTPEFSKTEADEFRVGDLRIQNIVPYLLNIGKPVDELYQLAADMGGAGYVFSGDHDADITSNSCTININVARVALSLGVKKLFFSSSACVYPERNQMDPENPQCSEPSAYPVAPDSEYGWEKIFSERMYASFARNYGLDVRIARFHNIYGPEGSWNNGKEKAPAALCRKVAEAEDGGEMEIWGDGKQTRSFLYIDECLEGVSRLMNAPKAFSPLNIGSEEMVSIEDLAKIIIAISKKSLTLKYISGPLGVRGRNSDNRLIQEKLGWQPNYPLQKGLEKTYEWINSQVHGK